MAIMDTKEKKDLPPRGSRNPDPITIEAGLGAAAGGLAAGFAAGLAGGPVGAVIGAVAGGVAGGLAGKAAGEWIDPTMDPLFRSEFTKKPYVRSDESFQDYTPVYQYGGQSESDYLGKPFLDVEKKIQQDYEASEACKMKPRKEARPAIEDSYNRARAIRDERLSK